MDVHEQVTICVGAITLEEYLARYGDEDPLDDVPSFTSPAWLKQLADKGLVTKNVIEDEQDDRL